MASRLVALKPLLTLSLLLILPITSCSPPEREQGSVKTAYDIGLVYLLKHPAIDKGIEGFDEELARIKARRGVEFKVTYSNAFGEVKNVNTIVQSFANSDNDIVVALTTPCAQVAKSVVTDRPVIFVGVTDPVGAGLVASLDKGQGNVTGTTSQVPNFAILQLATKILPEVRKIGILYNSSEANSVSILSSLDAEIGKNSLPVELIKRPVISTRDILPAARSLASQSDALFLINDNTVISSVELLVKVATDAGIPIFSSDTDSVAKGAFFTLGLDYKDEGIAAARMLEAILIERRPPSNVPIYINTKTHLYINREFIEKHPIPKEILADANIVG